MALYDATKAAMVAMTRTLAFEEAESGIRVNVVCPGSTLTDFHVNRTKAAGKSVEELKTQRQETSLLGRWADPLEIAYPILWMASDESSFITGTTLVGSEEHTSERQSLMRISYAVSCLKKKKK